MAIQPSESLAPKSAKYFQIGVLVIIVAGLWWWLKPTPYFPVTSQQMIGTWTMYDSGYDATGILEIHQDGSYITRYEHTSNRDYHMEGLGLYGSWRLNGLDAQFDDAKGHSTHTFKASTTEDKKKLKLLDTDAKLYFVFTRR